MRKKATSIPVNQFRGENDSDIAIERIAFKDLPDLEEWSQPERHDRHSFFLLEKGTVKMEIDFQTYTIKAPAIIYMHPDQVHRMLAFKDVIVNAWAIDNENLNPEYQKLLEDITPAKPLRLNKETFGLIADAASLCIRFAQREKDTLYRSLLKDSCNALVALTLAQYAEMLLPARKQSRFKEITRAFQKIVEQDFVKLKRPADYARRLNISTPYLNECVKNATGYPVGYHIQQRVILEAKRLLYHSNKSVKEIASILGYDDYQYFSRLFTKAVGMSALAFRNKNFD